MQHPSKNVQQAGEKTEPKPGILGQDGDLGVSHGKVKDKLVKRDDISKGLKEEKSANH